MPHAACKVCHCDATILTRLACRKGMLRVVQAATSLNEAAPLSR